MAVTYQVRSASLAGTGHGDEARREQGGELGPDIGDRVGLGRCRPVRRSATSPLLPAPAPRTASATPDDAERGVGQRRRQPGALLFEFRAAPSRLGVRARRSRRRRSLPTGRRVTRQGCCPASARPAGRLSFNTFRRRWHRRSGATGGISRHRRQLFGRRRIDPQVDSCPRLSERREAAHRVASTETLDTARQFVPYHRASRSGGALQGTGDGVRHGRAASRCHNDSDPPPRATSVAVGVLHDERHPADAQAAIQIERVDGRRTPAALAQRPLTESSSGPLSGSIAASTARAVSGAERNCGAGLSAGTVGAVTGSSRSAGACQANASPPGEPAHPPGVHRPPPSSAAPGSNRYDSGGGRSLSARCQGVLVVILRSATES